jgi:hypothetical protein
LRVLDDEAFDLKDSGNGLSDLLRGLFVEAFEDPCDLEDRSEADEAWILLCEFALDKTPDFDGLESVVIEQKPDKDVGVEADHFWRWRR